MPTVTENLSVWNEKYDWSKQGDEWTRNAAGTEAYWKRVIYPRISRFLPTGTILEIAPGYGRWTQFLKDHCQRMLVADLAPRCIEHCRQRFSGESHISYFINDGYSLPDVANQSVDFAFSFDSLVHAERDVIEAYVHELARILRPTGVAFLHHSNIGHYHRRLAVCGLFPGILNNLVGRLLAINVGAWRAPSMTADLMQRFVREAKLSCVSQELISWAHGRCMVDTISLICRPGSTWDGGTVIIENRSFARDVGRILREAASS